jgi:RimJ/RimL family protein N-acetyltransferase
VARKPATYRPRRLVLRDGREVTLRAITEADAPAIQRAFDRLSADSRYQRFLHHKKQLSPEALERGVHPQPGQAFAFVATVPRREGFDVVGAAQYVRAAAGNARTCEFAITLAEDWRGSGLARELLASLLRRARRDGYAVMMGLVLADNEPMLALARKLKFALEPSSEGSAVVRVVRTLATGEP